MVYEDGDKEEFTTEDVTKFATEEEAPPAQKSAKSPKVAKARAARKSSTSQKKPAAKAARGKPAAKIAAAKKVAKKKATASKQGKEGVEAEDVGDDVPGKPKSDKLINDLIGRKMAKVIHLEVALHELLSAHIQAHHPSDVRFPDLSWHRRFVRCPVLQGEIRRGQRRGRNDPPRVAAVHRVSVYEFSQHSRCHSEWSNQNLQQGVQHRCVVSLGTASDAFPLRYATCVVYVQQTVAPF